MLIQFYIYLNVMYRRNLYISAYHACLFLTGETNFWSPLIVTCTFLTRRQIILKHFTTLFLLATIITAPGSNYTRFNVDSKPTSCDT